MMSMANLPSSSTLFSTYASLTGSVMLVQSMVNQLIPQKLQTIIVSKFQSYFNPPTTSSHHVLIIEESMGYNTNEVYTASELFLRSKISRNSVEKLRVTKVQREKDFSVALFEGEEITDVYQGIKLTWKLVSSSSEKSHGASAGSDDGNNSSAHKQVCRSYKLIFDKEHKELVLDSYLPYVLKTAHNMLNEKKVLKLYTVDRYGGSWNSVKLEHPATFSTLAMDHSAKADIIDDLERFVRRKEFYKRVGKAWKRGYLLYGPPGTGKSSMVAAIANYLKFDVYDLELTNINSNVELREYLVSTSNKSILVIEDIDCSAELAERRKTKSAKHGQNSKYSKLTLSGVLNLIDGLWSSCGDERIIVFTTNHKDRLDPALLRPGRMDKHIHMSYCTTQGFHILASNYLEIHEDSKCKLYHETADLIGKSRVTPAEVAEELMKSEDADVALNELLNFLKRKKINQGDVRENRDEPQEPKKKKIQVEKKKKVEKVKETGTVATKARRPTARRVLRKR